VYIKHDFLLLKKTLKIFKASSIGNHSYFK